MVTTFLLIPGAGGEPWYWHRVVEELAARGCTGIPVDLPGDDPEAGLPEYADLAVAAGSGHGDLVVVGQSMGGFTAPLTVGRLPVRMLVLLNAMIPVPGETAGQWWEATGHEMPADFDLVTHFLHDVPADLAAAAMDGGREEVDIAFATPWSLPAWPDVPTRVLIAEDDRFFTADFQHRVAKERLGIDADHMPGGHLVALSRPAELADRLVAYARAVG